MKTAKEQRDLVKRTLLGEATGHWIETDMLISALDDLDELTSRLSEARGLLERAEGYILPVHSSPATEWIKVYEEWKK